MPGGGGGLWEGREKDFYEILIHEEKKKLFLGDLAKLTLDKGHESFAGVVFLRILRKMIPLELMRKTN